LLHKRDLWRRLLKGDRGNMQRRGHQQANGGVTPQTRHSKKKKKWGRTTAHGEGVPFHPERKTLREVGRSELQFRSVGIVPTTGKKVGTEQSGKTIRTDLISSIDPSVKPEGDFEKLKPRGGGGLAEGRDQPRNRLWNRNL